MARLHKVQGVLDPHSERLCQESGCSLGDQDQGGNLRSAASGLGGVGGR